MASIQQQTQLRVAVSCSWRQERASIPRAHGAGTFSWPSGKQYLDDQQQQRCVEQGGILIGCVRPGLMPNQGVQIAATLT